MSFNTNYFKSGTIVYVYWFNYSPSNVYVANVCLSSRSNMLDDTNKTFIHSSVFTLCRTKISTIITTGFIKWRSIRPTDETFILSFDITFLWLTKTSCKVTLQKYWFVIPGLLYIIRLSLLYCILYILYVNSRYSGSELIHPLLDTSHYTHVIGICNQYPVSPKIIQS